MLSISIPRESPVPGTLIDQVSDVYERVVMAISYLAEVGITSDLVLYGVLPEDAWHCWPDWLPKIYLGVSVEGL